MNYKSIQEYKADYENQKSQATRRKIDFNLTFGEWLGWWLDTGNLDRRGRKAGCFQMSRKDDLGAYELGNIECKTKEQNYYEGVRLSKERGTWGTNISNTSLKSKKNKATK
jgi:hypothetical protein